jgi:hypothetical protein
MSRSRAGWRGRRNGFGRGNGKRGWHHVLDGPRPFDAGELAIVGARRRFEWRVVGVTEDKKIEFQVTNRSTLTLPYLSIGVRAPHLEGRIWLPVAEIGPGSTKVVAFDCYSKWVEPTDTDIFSCDDPEPESRDDYWEFRTPSQPR